MQQHNIADWSQHPIKRLQKDIRHSLAVLMGEYLVMVVHNDENSETKILAYSPRDNKVQEGHPHYSLRAHYRVYTLNKYKENQIIRSEGFRSITQISIESFDRILPS